MTVTKRLKLKLLLLMLSSCSLSQHIPSIEISTDAGVIADRKEKGQGQCTPLIKETSGMMRSIVKPMAQASGGSQIVASAAYGSEMASRTAMLHEYQPGVTRYWEYEQRSSVM